MTSSASYAFQSHFQYTNRYGPTSGRFPDIPSFPAVIVNGHLLSVHLIFSCFLYLLLFHLYNISHLHFRLPEPVLYQENGSG